MISLPSLDILDRISSLTRIDRIYANGMDSLDGIGRISRILGISRIFAK